MGALAQPNGMERGWGEGIELPAICCCSALVGQECFASDPPHRKFSTGSAGVQCPFLQERQYRTSGQGFCCNGHPNPIGERTWLSFCRGGCDDPSVQFISNSPFSVARPWTCSCISTAGSTALAALRAVIVECPTRLVTQRGQWSQTA